MDRKELLVFGPSLDATVQFVKGDLDLVEVFRARRAQDRIEKIIKPSFSGSQLLRPESWLS